MFDYLRTGLASNHAIAGGPMQTVVAGIGEADPADVRAIATYVVSLMGEWSPERKAQAAARMERAGQPLAGSAATGGASMSDGAAVYASACASCHDRGRRIASDGALQMPLAIAVYDPDPRSLLRIIRAGIAPREGERGRWMPAFGEALTDTQLTALAAYLRSYAADAFPWPDLEHRVKELSR